MSYVRPRRLSFPIKAINLFGLEPLFGWIFFGFGMIFFWIFTLNSDITGLYWFHRGLETVQGRVIYNEATKYNTEEEIITYANHYSFVGKDGTEYTSVSYADYPLNEGKKVTVEYPEDRPGISRIKGMSRRPVHPLLGGAMIFLPLIGLYFIIKGLRKGIKANHLLRSGILTTGRLTAKTATEHEAYGKRVYDLAFEFTDETGQKHKVVTRTHLTQRLEDTEDEPLVYDPVQPSSAVMIDDLPSRPRIDENGNVETEKLASVTLRLIFSLVLPAATIIGHSIYIYYHFFAK